MRFGRTNIYGLCAVYDAGVMVVDLPARGTGPWVGF